MPSASAQGAGTSATPQCPANIGHRRGWSGSLARVSRADKQARSLARGEERASTDAGRAIRSHSCQSRHSGIPQATQGRETAVLPGKAQPDPAGITGKPVESVGIAWTSSCKTAVSPEKVSRKGPVGKTGTPGPHGAAQKRARPPLCQESHNKTRRHSQGIP